MLFNECDEVLKEKLDNLKHKYNCSNDPHNKKRYYNMIFALLYGRFKNHNVINDDLFYKYCAHDLLYMPILVDIENMQIQNVADKMTIKKALYNLQTAINVLTDVINKM